MEIVLAIKQSVAERIGAERFELWMRRAKIEVRGHRVIFVTPSEFTMNWMRNHLRDDLELACQSVLGGEIALEFSVDSSLSTESNESANDDSADSESTTGSDSSTGAATPAKAAPLSPPEQPNSRRRFCRLETFVAGETNRIAASSAEMVIRQPGALSPLFLYGGTGTGKTHLSQGIWSAMRRAPQPLRTVYLSSEQFTTYFLQALNGAGLPSFRRRYRQVDLLIIEDIQFFAGKRATIVELQHTIDAVLREGRQLVLTADCPPNDLMALGSEMLTRLTGGLVVRVETPDLVARQVILTEEAKRRGVNISQDVVEFIAEHVMGDARRLHGALSRLQAHSMAWNTPITIEMAAETLEDVFRTNSPVVRLSDIESAVCSVFEVTPSQIRSSNRARRVSHPRMLAMWLARKYTRAGLVEIGEYFGRRSHATVISASKKVDGWVGNRATMRLTDQECAVKEAIRQVERRLLG